MLLIWDRGFFSYELIHSVCRAADLLGRVKSNTILKPLRRLDDGSYLANIYPDAALPPRPGGLPVRVIEFIHDDPNRPGAASPSPDHGSAQSGRPAGAAAPLVYHERWEEEFALDEIKTHLSGRAVPIRSQTPAGVVQGIYGMILAHYVVRRVMHDAAVVSCQDPDRLSFTDSLRILQCQLPKHYQEIEAWYQRLLREVRRQKLRPRRERWYPRVIKKERCPTGARRGQQTSSPTTADQTL